MKIESSLSFTGVSTFLKKFRILALFFAGVFAWVFVFADALFFPPVPLLTAGTLLFDCGRGVRGFVDIADVEGGRVRGAEVPCGGVGARPVDGRTGLEEGKAFSRGLRNIVCGHR
jgi:hypothetical protein